jgi:hypothetical protein
MTRFKDREKALLLRKQNKSYSQIKKILKVSKSTLSYWLRKYPLSKQRIKELRDCNEQRIERFRETMRKKKEVRLQQFYNEQKQFLLPLSKRELFLAGIFLYWGEGKKTSFTEVSVSNTDPSMIKFFITWIVNSLKVPRDKIKIQLHLYKNMEVKKEIDFWSNTLNFPENQFNKPYIKESSSLRINHKGGFGHGTCNVRIGGAQLTEKIFMAIKVIADKYHKMRV